MINDKFRNYLPVVVDIETGGFDSKNKELKVNDAIVYDPKTNWIKIRI